MEKIYFNRTDWNHYNAGTDFTYHKFSPSLVVLGCLLAEEVAIGDTFEWIEDENLQRSGNNSFIYKEDNNIILSMYYFGDDFIFTVRQDLFLRLLKAWIELYPLQLKRLNLTREGDRFTFDWDTGRGTQQLVIE